MTESLGYGWSRHPDRMASAHKVGQFTILLSLSQDRSSGALGLALKITIAEKLLDKSIA